jgi:hypothetical protein
MNTYEFIFECEGADLKEMRRVFKHIGNIRKTPKMWGKCYDEELGWCGARVYRLKTELDFNAVKILITSGVDLHYPFQTLIKK